MHAGAATVVIVEDHQATCDFLSDNLLADGFKALQARSAEQGLQLMETQNPDLAVVDLGLPDRDGLELVRQVRETDSVVGRIDPELPLLVLTGRSGELDRLRGFERGCDDYVVKPFAYPELRVRIEALLRRSKSRAKTGTIRVGRLVIDPVARRVLLAGEPVALTKKEFALLRALAAEPTRVFTREELLRSVWGFQSIGETRTVDSHASRLRQKLSAGSDKFVVNVWGVGYRLVDGGIP